MRSRSDRQPAAAPGRRAAPSRPAGPLVQARPLGCGLAYQQSCCGSVAEGHRVKSALQRPCGLQPSPGEGPQLASARAAPPQAAARAQIRTETVIFNSLFFIVPEWAQQPAVAPPGGGLLLYVAGPSARLRAGLSSCRGSVAEGASGKIGLAKAVRAAASRRGGPQLLGVARVLCRLQPEFEYVPKRARESI